MNHLSFLSSCHSAPSASLYKKLSGQYYTNTVIAERLAETLSKNMSEEISLKRSLSIIDPFSGDGRLVVSFLKALRKKKELLLGKAQLTVDLWDIDKNALDLAVYKINKIDFGEVGIELRAFVTDSFNKVYDFEDSFDIVLSNPPWEVLKPNRKDFAFLSADDIEKYIDLLREYDNFLSKAYPASQPNKKFAGWGTNLSRVGFEACQRLCANDGVVGIVMPASFLADGQSSLLRKSVFEEWRVFDISYYPAEARLFKGVDVDFSTLILSPSKKHCGETSIKVYDKNNVLAEKELIRIDMKKLSMCDYIIPVATGLKSSSILERIRECSVCFEEYEKDKRISLWTGREIDETRSQDWLVDDCSCGVHYIKGKMIRRFGFSENPTQYVDCSKKRIPKSSKYKKIVWRDVSRQSQKRRLIATIVDSGFVAGNSLGVAYCDSPDSNVIYTILGIMTSLVFEFQLKSSLTTNHISLGALRKCFVPKVKQVIEDSYVRDSMMGIICSYNEDIEREVDAYIAKYFYGVTRDEYGCIINSFNKITNSERSDMLKAYDSFCDGEK